MWLEKRRNRYFAVWREGKYRKREPLYTDKKASQAKMAELLQRMERKETNLIDPYEDHRNRPLTEHVQDWIEYLGETGKSDSYIRLCGGRMARLIDDCGWERLADIKADDLEEWRETAVIIPSGAVAGKKSEEKELTPRAKNHYFETLRTFCRWCVKKKRMAENPVMTVEPLPVYEEDQRRLRRAYTPDELSRLLAVIPERFRPVYFTAAFTGLRRQELELLEWGDVCLNAPRPFIKLRAKTTKARRGDTLPLRADVAEWLRSIRGEARDDEKVFSRVRLSNAIKRGLARRVLRGKTTGAGGRTSIPCGQPWVPC